MEEKKLEALNKYLDKIALEKRLNIEANHLKRIKCTKTLRIYTTISGDRLLINTRIINERSIEDNAKLWSLVKRVLVIFDSDMEETIFNDIELLSKELGIEKNDDPEENINNSSLFEKSNDECMPLSICNDVFSKVGTDNKCYDPVINSKCEYKDIYEWDSSSEACGFMVPLPSEKRKAQLLIKFQNKRDVYRLTKKLHNVIGKEAETKSNVIKELYKYINSQNLNNYETSIIKCDNKLKDLFGVESFDFRTVGDMVDIHLIPFGYCVLNINFENPEIWDIRIDCDDLGQMPILYPKIVQSMDKKIDDVTMLINKKEDKIRKLSEFISDPVLFINRNLAIDSNPNFLKTKYYENLNVLANLFELIKKNNK